MKLKFYSLAMLILVILVFVGCKKAINVSEPSEEVMVEEQTGAGIKYDTEYIFDEEKSIGMKLLMNSDIDSINEMNIEDIEVAIEKVAQDDITVARESDLSINSTKMNDQQANIIVGYYVDDVYWNARVTGVFKDEVKWFVIDRWTELEPLNQIINRRIQLIMDNKEAMVSSNPYDYTKENKDYDYIIGLGEEALEIMLKQLKESEGNGLREYILAIACSELLSEDIKDKTWSTGKEWYELYDKSNKENIVFREEDFLLVNEVSTDRFELIVSSPVRGNSEIEIVIE